MEQMDCKPYQPLSKVRREMELAYTSSSDESDDGQNVRKSYTSRETLPDYTQDVRLSYNSHKRQKTLTEPEQELEFCETPPQMMCPPSFQAELHGYPLGAGWAPTWTRSPRAAPRPTTPCASGCGRSSRSTAPACPAGPTRCSPSPTPSRSASRTESPVRAQCFIILHAPCIAACLSF
ncbi:hypothetical protein ANANG_G00059300 [Anguilla anguilla]|uniref:Teneurin N-terminal domain-containing protein n=1 Tax=Anguilla anguilla TaxID=7936 RepID=A0A9D3MQP3_ANGAN|nr:hypothetical protein ANANG_G00059300 [Anguilla anguilla]